ncbi:hypothetical protein GC089_01030 [Cellulomonas sp. JZ18]|uniref:DUF6318 family protein n=1 Tax=Cellulomonas sp. JZ18 TaxID=2654191 RepID=UPI0012D42624|nr:DUF6318 family protein [Cellulomonas sp. JZ18]QGQ18108.1 hypothetical protein GC089_01030 [Cellulomonas sp. JZ18]
MPNRYFPGMQGRRRWGRAVSAGLLVGLLVTGCTRAEPTEPTPEPPSPATETARPTPTPSPTVDLSVPPTRPEAMATPSADGAAAAASYFISLYPYVYVTGDFTEWDAMSAPTCEFCSESRVDVQRMLDAGNSTTGASVEVLSAEGIELSHREWYSARLRVKQGEGVELDSAGTVVSSNPEAVYDFDFAMTWLEGAWRIDSVGLHPAGQE